MMKRLEGSKVVMGRRNGGQNRGYRSGDREKYIDFVIWEVVLIIFGGLLNVRDWEYQRRRNLDFGFG